MTGELIQTMRQLFNFREGIRPEDFKLPKRLIDPPPTGPGKWYGRSVRLVLPPTYLGYRRTIAEMRDPLNDFLGAEGHRVVDARLPFKLLAARCGLAEYGRNNILYRSGVGSFLQLGAFFTDLPCDGDPWRPPGMLERCKSCDACARACPTGAIGRERFLLRAERCITFHNERATPLPGWIGRGWHDCLVGCMICQRSCPENRSVIRNFTDRVSFSEEETAQLLGADRGHPPAPELLAKWEALGFTEDLGRLMRNLSTLLDHSERGSHRQKNGE